MNAKRRKSATLAGVFLVGISHSAATQAADIATPAVLAATCNNCHGPDGASPGAMPSIDKLSAADLSAKLKGFRSGEKPATVMTRIAKGYTDAEIEALGQYIASHHH